MRRWVKALLFTGLGILAAGLIALFIAYAINGFSFRRAILPGHHSGNVALKNVEENIDEEFSNLLMEVASYDIRLEKSEDGICHIKYKDVDEEGSSFQIGVENGTLKIKQINDDIGLDWDSLDHILDNLYNKMDQGFGIELQEGEFVIALPEREYDTLELKTASGEIVSEQPVSCSTANMSSASGELVVQNIKGKNSLNLATASGSVYVKNAEGFEMMNIASASGEVVVDNAVLSSEINITTTSGEMKLDKVSVNGKAELESTSGTISLINTTFVSGEVETTSGEVYLENAAAETLSINTTSGDVFGRIDADINVHGTTTSGDFHAPSGSKGNWEINTTSGDVNLSH